MQPSPFFGGKQLRRAQQVPIVMHLQRLEQATMELKPRNVSELVSLLGLLLLPNPNPAAAPGPGPALAEEGVEEAADPMDQRLAELLHTDRAALASLLTSQVCYPISGAVWHLLETAVQRLPTSAAEPLPAAAAPAAVAVGASASAAQGAAPEEGPASASAPQAFPAVLTLRESLSLLVGYLSARMTEEGQPLPPQPTTAATDPQSSMGIVCA